MSPPVPREATTTSEAPERPAVLVVGSASRDIVDDDPRGWRLGGGVSYSALATAKLGLPTRAVIGVDRQAATASEIDLIRAAGVEIQLVELENGPVFVNIERPEGRLQLCHSPSDPIPVDAVPEAWRKSPGWLLAPVADELPDEWARAAPDEAFVALGWQGLLRELTTGEQVRSARPTAGAIVGRADLAGLSRDDVDRGVAIEDLTRFLRRRATLVVTQSDRGGLVARLDAGHVRLRHYPPVPSHAAIDATGAGDTFLAALAAARIEPRLVGRRIAAGFDLLMAAAAASLVLEAPGLQGVPDREAVRARMTEARGWAMSPEGDGREPRPAVGRSA
ncbi:MAG TPA: PfkB family carbohydrate kinase [Candidatus Limnocylindrales bacterium]